MSRPTPRQHAMQLERLPAVLRVIQEADGDDDPHKLDYLIRVRNKDPNQRTAEGQTPSVCGVLVGKGSCAGWGQGVGRRSRLWTTCWSTSASAMQVSVCGVLVGKGSCAGWGQGVGRRSRPWWPPWQEPAIWLPTC